MNQSVVRKVVVLGAGSAGYLSAVTIKRLLPELDVSIVHSAKIPVIGVGESTTAYLPRFLHETLALDQARFFREVKPVFKLGIRFIWGAPEDTHFNYTFDGLLQVRPNPLRKRLSYYCLRDWNDFGHFSALMDRQLAPCYFTYGGQYQLQKGYGYHINNRLFLQYLQGIANELGVTNVIGDVVEVTRGEDGSCQELVLEDGRKLCGDLFVDCSGFASVLLKQQMLERYQSYDQSLFCDRAAVGSWANDGVVNPYTTSETMNHGWCWRIDFADRITRGYVFSSQFCSDDEAIAELQQKNPLIQDDIQIVRFRSGRYENFWSGNVLAIGNASGFVEPLEATALHLIAQQLTSVCGALLDADLRIEAEVIREDNRQYRRAWDEVRDFLALHYKFNRHSNSPFWRHCRNDTDFGRRSDACRHVSKGRATSQL